MQLTITVPGEPVAKQRPRFIHGGHVYTPKKTVNYEKLIAISVRNEMVKRRIKLTTKPIKLEVIAYFATPESWPNWKKKLCLEGRLAHTKKPDADNILKIVEDSLNGVLYKDDSQIIFSSIGKGFCVMPSLTIKVCTYDNLIPCNVKNKKQAEQYYESN